ncbi:hypothetical protein BC940DRAFT_296478 [Gongronella butleri]|nr:hypothetical protein BC940DRAFT_296478 [Gongronella butleri]
MAWFTSGYAHLKTTLSYLLLLLLDRFVETQHKIGVWPPQAHACTRGRMSKSSTQIQGRHSWENEMAEGPSKSRQFHSTTDKKAQKGTKSVVQASCSIKRRAYPSS